jgi:hypothetical protein
LPTPGFRFANPVVGDVEVFDAYGREFMRPSGIDTATRIRAEPRTRH